MAVEKNPFDKKEETSNVVSINAPAEDSNVSFEVDTDGGVTVNFSEDKIEEEVTAKEYYANLADGLDDEILQDISHTVIENFQADKDSRGEWDSMFERGFDLLGLKLEDTTEPFEGACTAVHPLLIESAVKFQSKASQELFPVGGPVKAQILGTQSADKQEQANRVQNFMNYQLTEQMPEYFDEFERMLFHLPLIGSAIKKVYYDASLERPVSEFVPIDQFYVSYYASNLRKADRYTHIIYRNPVDMKRDIESGIYADVDLPDASNPVQTTLSEKLNTIMGISPTADKDPQYVLLEQHIHLDIPDSECEEGEFAPYIVTVE